MTPRNNHLCHKKESAVKDVEMEGETSAAWSASAWNLDDGSTNPNAPSSPRCEEDYDNYEDDGAAAQSTAAAQRPHAKASVVADVMVLKTNSTGTSGNGDTKGSMAAEPSVPPENSSSGEDNNHFDDGDVHDDEEHEEEKKMDNNIKDDELDHTSGRDAYASLDPPIAMDNNDVTAMDSNDPPPPAAEASAPVDEDDVPTDAEAQEEEEEGEYSFVELIRDSELILPEDRFMAPDHVLIAMAQLIPCKLTKADRKGVYKHLNIGFLGMCCRWCGGKPPRGRYFPNQESNCGRVDTHNAIVRHFDIDCEYCPPHIYMGMRAFERGPHDRYGNRKGLAQHLWERIQSSKPVRAADLLMHPENRRPTPYDRVPREGILSKSKLRRKEETPVVSHTLNVGRASKGLAVSRLTVRDDGENFTRKRKVPEPDSESHSQTRKKKRVKDEHRLTIKVRPTRKVKMDYYVEEYAHWEHNPTFPFILKKPSAPNTTVAAATTSSAETTGSPAPVSNPADQSTTTESNHEAAAATVLSSEPTAVTESTQGARNAALPPEESQGTAPSMEPDAAIAPKDSTCIPPAAEATSGEDGIALEEEPLDANSRLVVTDTSAADLAETEIYGVSPDDLPKIPGPAPFPAFPNTGKCIWTMDLASRVLMADFTCQAAEPQFSMHPVDSKFFFKMMERDDITVISRGLLNFSKLKPNLWNMDYIGERLQEEFHHKFRRFDRVVDEDGKETFKEVDKMHSMQINDFVRYMKMRSAYLDEIKRKDPGETMEEPVFTFLDAEDKEHSVSVGTTALYMIDVDVKRQMPWLLENFHKSFSLPAVLPGGSHCMMNPVTSEARPFMGPNLYITPPASFTQFHQDGHGTVDSGHLVISGYNEVVMLRRLKERHKKHALWILTGKRPNKTWWDGLYSEPHGDGLGQKPGWPTVDMIRECEDMGYCPTVCILEPGDLIHINKGRLHAFRKMSTSQLPPSDCHAQMRSDLIARKGLAGEQICVSVAWDWMYRGVTSAGINREVCTVLEATILNQKHGVVSLAIPEFSLLHMAKQVVAPAPVEPFGSGCFLTNIPNCVEMSNSLSKAVPLYDASPEEICRGILPGLRHVITAHLDCVATAEPHLAHATGRGDRLRLKKIPDTQPNPATHPLDPLGNTDFACRLCKKELSNVYYHCDGCEQLLSKDYNICNDCYDANLFMEKEQMHPTNPKRHATLNHTGDFSHNRQSRCPCKNGPACNICGWCLGCSCRCHTWFTMHTRLMKPPSEHKLLGMVEQVAGEPSTLHKSKADNWSLPTPEDPHKYDVATMTTLANERFQDAKDSPPFMMPDP